jgi:DNA-binding Xre family transcriptional regulator
MHIGQKISEIIAQRRTTKQELGRAIGLTGSSATYLTTRASIDVETLQKVGNILKYDFFKHFPVDEEGTGGKGHGTGEIKSEKDLLIDELKEKIMEKERTILALRREVTLMKQENQYLKKINDLLEAQGKK